MIKRPPIRSASEPQQSIPPTSLPQEKKVSQAKKAIQEAAKYYIGRTADDYETSKVVRKERSATDEEKKAVEDLNSWGGGAYDDDDDF